MSNVIRLVLLFVLSQGTLAKAMEPSGAGDCSSLLASPAPASELDYALSDIEGTYLELIKKVQSAPEIPADRIEFFIKDVLNMKASLLNDVLDLLPMILVTTADGPKRSRLIASLYNMLDSLGVPPALYGLEVNSDSRILLPAVPKKVRAAANRKPKEVRNNPIGFVVHPPAEGEPAPEGTRRSIGFGPQTLESHPAPDRQTGYIQRGLRRDNSLIMVIFDREKNAQYEVDLRVLASAGGQSEGHKFQLNFNTESREWVVLVENVNNPTGRLGFQ